MSKEERTIVDWLLEQADMLDGSREAVFLREAAGEVTRLREALLYYMNVRCDECDAECERVDEDGCCLSCGADFVGARDEKARLALEPSGDGKIARLYGEIEAEKDPVKREALTVRLRELQQAEADRADEEFRARYKPAEVRAVLDASRKLREGEPGKVGS